MDVGRSFTFVTQDPQWISKLAIAAAIYAAGTLLFPIGWILLGYQLEVTRRTYTGQDLPLPEWDNIGDYFVRGLLVNIGIMIWILPMVAIFACVIIAGVAADNSGGLAAILGFCVAGPLLLAFMAFVLPIVIARFAVEQRFSAMLDIGDILTEARRAIGPLALNAVVAVAVLLGATLIGFMACFIGILVTIPFAYLVLGHLLGQVYRSAHPDAAAVVEAF